MVTSARRPLSRSLSLPGLVAGLLALAFVAACGRERPSAAAGDVGGTLVIASAGDPDMLLPPLVTSLQGAQISSQLFDRLAEIDSTLKTVGDAAFAPRLATGWTWAPDSLSIRFALGPRARWHDGQPVRAADVKYSFELYADPATGSPVAELLGNVAGVDVADPLTAVVRFKSRRPEQFFDFVYNVYVLPSHLLASTPHAQLRTAAFARQPVGTGRFRFVRWEANQRVELVADTMNWRGRPKLDRVIWSFAPDPGAATAKLLAGEADVWEMIRGDAIGRVATTPTLRAMPYPSLDVGYLLFNVRGGLFADRALRRALAASIDREALVRSALDTTAYVAWGPAPRALGGEKKGGRLGFDLTAATKTLDSLGWTLGPDGVRARGGRPLAFSLVVPTTSQTRIRLAVLLQAQLKQVGARVTIDQLEPNAMMQRIGTRQFDAMLHAWHADPSPSTVRQAWGAVGANTPGSSNFAGYASRSFDALVDSASAAFDPAVEQTLYDRAYDVLSEDAPAVWLYELRNFAGVHKRLRPVGVRADAWWAQLADWSIPAGERIARDRIGLRTASR